MECCREIVLLGVQHGHVHLARHYRDAMRGGERGKDNEVVRSVPQTNNITSLIIRKHNEKDESGQLFEVTHL